MRGFVLDNASVRVRVKAGLCVLVVVVVVVVVPSTSTDPRQCGRMRMREEGGLELPT